MATSRTGGAFGFLRKSVGSVTYSTLKDGKGKRVQVVRSKPTEVANPNTVAQILQRMKVKPASRFYAAYAEVLSNAFEGIQYGDASRREFMRLAMQLDGPFVPKGANRFIPAVYPVSRGSFIGAKFGYEESDSLDMPWYGKKGFFANFSADDEGAHDSYSLSHWANEYFGRDVQITFLAVTQSADGSFEPHYARILTADHAETTGNGNWFGYFSGFSVVYHGAVCYLVAGQYSEELTNAEKIAAFEGIKAAACIISVKDGETYVRSNSDMFITDAIQINLYGNEAQQTAVESYQDSANVNQLNSTWYLNLANGQQFPGRLELQNVHLEFSVEQEGEQTTVVQDLIAPVGIQVEADGRIRNYVFADAGGNAIFNVNGNYETVAEPGGAADAKIKWADVLIQTSLYGARISTWKEAYQIQIAS